MQSDESRRQLYQMMAAQLQHDGFHDAARTVARSTMCTSLPLNGDPSRLLGLATLGMHAEAVGMTGGYLNRNDWRSLPAVEGHVGIGDSAVALTDERWSRFAEKYAASAKQAVRATCFSQDGMYAAGGSSDGTVRIHDVPAMHSRYLRHDDGTICRSYNDHTQAVHNVCFHPTEPMLLTGGRDGKIHMHGYTNPTNKTKTIEDTYPIRGLVCHPGGKHLLYSTDHPSLRFYDLERGQIMTNAPADQHKNAVWDVAYTSDGRRFASASADGALKVWDGVAGHVSVVKNKAHCGADVTSVAFSRSGDYLLSAGRDGQAILWDLRRQHTSVKTFGTAQRIAHRPTANFLFREDVVVANIDQDDTVVVAFEVRSQQVLSKMVHPAAVRSVAASPVEQSFLSGSDDFSLRLWGPSI